jgi:6-pyruvoyltetrahydropterin/6-carboxytetrahydropterin synthase
MIIAQRYHDFCAGHRVAGHESKCAHFHGHNYRVHFQCEADKLDKVGRVIDFSEIKTRLCDWLEREWDHKFLLWQRDPFLADYPHLSEALPGLVLVPFNPTAENMAEYLLTAIAPVQLTGTGVRLRAIKIDETRKCSVFVSAKGGL